MAGGAGATAGSTMVAALAARPQFSQVSSSWDLFLSTGALRFGPLAFGPASSGVSFFLGLEIYAIMPSGTR